MSEPLAPPPASPGHGAAPGYPQVRMRRLRRTPALRRAFTETRIHPADLVVPLFVKDGIEEPAPVGSMPGVVQHTRRSIADEVARLHSLGIDSVIIFGIPADKDPEGAAGWDPDGCVPAAVRTIRDRLGDEVAVWTDVCLCEYTDHGHCGPLLDGVVDNDAAVAGYIRQALVHAEAGADLVAPSGMMDGQVGAIRAGLDADGYAGTGIVAYAAKFASGYYGPFRDAAESAPSSGDRRGYQQPPANRREAAREIAFDVDEGADAVMVKPALAYLDVVSDARRATALPVAAYHVSGEYAAVAAAGERGWLDADRVLFESVLSIRRAGADLVLTYAAEAVVRQLD